MTQYMTIEDAAKYSGWTEEQLFQMIDEANIDAFVSKDEIDRQMKRYDEFFKNNPRTN